MHVQGTRARERDKNTLKNCKHLPSPTNLHIHPPTRLHLVWPAQGGVRETHQACKCGSGHFSTQGYHFFLVHLVCTWVHKGGVAGRRSWGGVPSASGRIQTSLGATSWGSQVQANRREQRVRQPHRGGKYPIARRSDAPGHREDLGRCPSPGAGSPSRWGPPSGCLPCLAPAPLDKCGGEIHFKPRCKKSGGS